MASRDPQCRARPIPQRIGTSTSALGKHDVVRLYVLESKNSTAMDDTSRASAGLPNMAHVFLIEAGGHRIDNMFLSDHVELCRPHQN
jgi:hypothetical protein